MISPPSDAPYKQYPIGIVGLTLPTFLKTDRNPSEVLEGLKAGAVTKFTPNKTSRKRVKR